MGDYNIVYPRLKIFDINDTELYNYTANTLDASGTRDFNLRSLALHLGINEDLGGLVFVIDDPDGNMIDSNGEPLIQEQYGVKLELGETLGSLTSWFYGIVIDVESIETSTNMTQYRVTCVNWTIRLVDRLTNITRFQKKDSDGITLDSTDTDASTAQITSEIITQSDHLTDENFPKETKITTGGIDLTNADNLIPELQQQFQTFASTIAHLSATAGTVYGVNGDRELFFRFMDATDSGLMISNDTENTKVTTHDQDKVLNLLDERIQYRNTSKDAGISIIHGLNSNTIVKDIDQTTEDATLSMDTNWYAIPFVPTKPNLTKIALRLAKTGNPSDGEARFFIANQDSSSDPDEASILSQMSLSQEELRALDSTLGWVEINLDRRIDLNVGSTYYIICKQYGDATNTFVMSYDSAGSDSYEDSTDGATWTNRATNTVVLRTFASERATITLEDVRARRKYRYREKAIEFKSGEESEHVIEALDFLSDILSVRKREYNSISVSIPNTRVEVGKYAHLLLKGKWHRKVNIIGLDLVIDSGDVGTDKMTLEIQENIV